MHREAFLLALLSLALASDVLEFTDDDFADKITQHDLILVEFFAPWCGHCKRLAPEYESAATILKNNDPPVPLAKIDCTANTKSCQKFGVSGYPTLKIFRNGEFSEEYSGARESDGIVKHLRSKAGPSSKLITTVEEAEKFLASKEYCIIGFFDSLDSELAKPFQKVADSLSTDFRFAHTSEAAVMDKYGYKNNIIMFQPSILHSIFEEHQMKFTDDATVYKIKTWIKDTALGLCGHRTQGNAENFRKPLIVAYFNVDYVKNQKGTNYWRNRIMKAAKILKKSDLTVYFAISNHKDFNFELGEFGVEDAAVDKPPVVTARDTSDRKFVMHDSFSPDNVVKFARDLLDGKLEPYLKSEPIPEDNSGPVKVVVAKNFNEIVNDPDKDVLIEFYAPWCGHCKALEPKYKELGEKLAGETELTIAKMDATANDVPKPFEVQGFPTIYYVPKGSKSNPKTYKGEREVDDFVKYLAKEATNEFKKYDRNGKRKKQKKVDL